MNAESNIIFLISLHLYFLRILFLYIILLHLSVLYIPEYLKIHYYFGNCVQGGLLKELTIDF